MRQSGIRRVLVVCAERPASDLEPILIEWQASGIALWSRLADDAKARPCVLERRSWLSRVPDMVRRAFLKRRSDGSYGMWIPMQPSGG